MADHGVFLHTLMAQGPDHHDSLVSSDTDDASSEASGSWKGGPDDRGDTFATTSNEGEVAGFPVEVQDILRLRNVVGLLVQFVGTRRPSRLRFLLKRW